LEETGDIWWWNNYDIFLIVLGVVVLNLIFAIAHRFFYFNLQKISLVVVLLGFSCAYYQIKTRDFNFAYSGHTKNYQEYELKSKQIQRNILGDKLYSMMESFDSKLKIYF
jgi:inner membrane protein